MLKKVFTGLAALVAAVALTSSGCQSAHSNVTAVFFTSSFTSNDELLRIPDGEFSAIEKVEALPTPVKTALAATFGQSSLKMANPGEPFNATDVMDSYPTRRLIFAGCTKERCLVHYEKGGRGQQYLAILFKLDDKGNADIV